MFTTILFEVLIIPIILMGEKVGVEYVTDHYMKVVKYLANLSQH